MIELKNVSFEYENRKVFENLNLSISKGQKVGIVGESGCGKSTLLKLIAGLYKPSFGSLVVDGETEPEKISRKVSVVMQTPMLLPLTIYENITMGLILKKKWKRHAEWQIFQNGLIRFLKA